MNERAKPVVAERDGWRRAFGQMAAQFISARSDLRDALKLTPGGTRCVRHDDRTAEIIEECKRIGGVE